MQKNSCGLRICSRSQIGGVVKAPESRRTEECGHSCLSSYVKVTCHRQFNFIRRIICGLLIGLIATFSLSWAAMFVPHQNQMYGPPASIVLGLHKDTHEYSRIWQISEGENLWHHAITYNHQQMSGMSYWMADDEYELQKFDYAENRPRHLQPDSLNDLNMQATYREVGFPFASLTCSIHWETQVRNSDILYTVQGGWQLPRDADFTPRALPYTPVWPGFLLNILTWATAWWICRWGILGARTRYRRKRGSCIQCGYSQRGLPAESRCPECGRGNATS